MQDALRSETWDIILADHNMPDFDAPQALNEDPYGEGWICAIRMSDPDEYDRLLDAAAYSALIEA